MCDHCGCREITPIQRLMAEHESLLDLAAQLRATVVNGNEAAARAILAALTEVLHPHVQAEEQGLFAVLRERGEFLDHIDWLETEHMELSAKLAAPLTGQIVLGICDELREHIHREEYGLFPFALADLGGEDWAAVVAREAGPPG